jgi:hypothetical protein
MGNFWDNTGKIAELQRQWRRHAAKLRSTSWRAKLACNLHHRGREK